MPPTSASQLTCLCGGISAPGSLLLGSNIPTEAAICHCNSCRQSTGSLIAAFSLLKAAPPYAILLKLTAYRSSETHTRYFCSICGCHCFIENKKKKVWFCLSGIIEPSSGVPDKSSWPSDTIKVISHDFVSDPIDGGLVPVMLKLGNRVVPTWSIGAREPPKTYDLAHATVLTMARKSAISIPHPEKNTFLSAKCRCGGVSLSIKHANFANGGSARYMPRDPTKYLTYLCACRSCRFSTGSSLTAWSLIPSTSVFNANASHNYGNDSPGILDEPLISVIFGKAACEPDANPGQSLKHNWSSPDVCRSFCGVCGATVSYWCSQRPDELDVAVGILRAEEGSMARTWLDWEWGRCSSTEECIDKSLCDAWVGGAEIMQGLEA